MTPLHAFGILLSPTRAFADYLKSKCEAAPFIRYWSFGFLFFAIAVSFLVYVVFSLPTGLTLPFLLILGFAWLIPFSRVNEIFCAFLFDGLDCIRGRIRGRNPKTPLEPADRVVLAGSSYLETIINFGLIHYLLFSNNFSRNFQDVFEAIYFSGVTITTIGYGDLAPCGVFPQMLSIYEVIIGYVLIFIAFSVYIGAPRR